MELLVHALLSVCFGFSLAVLLVEKGEDWPVTFITKPLKWLTGLIYSKLKDMLSCTVCTSFWATLIGELILKFFITDIFLWPLTGVITLGFTWVVIDFLNALDKSKN